MPATRYSPISLPSLTLEKFHLHNRYSFERFRRTMKTSEEKPVGNPTYLLTDEGFMYRLAVNFVFVSSLVVLFARLPILREVAVDSYFRINDTMLTMAHQYAWWSLLGLLSSSCCALQLILNSMSMGCAGFNTVLGPVRPTLLSITILVQLGSWHVAWSRPWQWFPTAISSGVVLILSFLPELLSSYHVLFSKKRRRKVFGQSSNDHSTTLSNQTFCFKMTSVGCLACISTVSGVLENLNEVQNFEASIKKGILHVTCQEGTTREYVLKSLQDAGFPMESI